MGEVISAPSHMRLFSRGKILLQLWIIRHDIGKHNAITICVCGTTQGFHEFARDKGIYAKRDHLKDH